MLGHVIKYMWHTAGQLIDSPPRYTWKGWGYQSQGNRLCYIRASYSVWTTFTYDKVTGAFDYSKRRRRYIRGQISIVTPSLIWVVFFCRCLFFVNIYFFIFVPASLINSHTGPSSFGAKWLDRASCFPIIFYGKLCLVFYHDLVTWFCSKHLHTLQISSHLYCIFPMKYWLHILFIIYF